MRRLASLGLLLALPALLAPAGAAAGPADPPRPVTRYWMLARADGAARELEATIHYNLQTRESVGFIWIVEVSGGRRVLREVGPLFGYSYWAVLYGVGGVSTPRCPAELACVGDAPRATPLSYRLPITYEFYVATKGIDVRIEPSASSGRHWKFKELKGSPAVTGELQLDLPEGSGATGAEAVNWGVQHLRSATRGGWQHGSFAAAMAPCSIYGSGEAELSGGEGYPEGRKLKQGTYIVAGYASRATRWAVTGDLKCAGSRTGPVLARYNLPSRTALLAYMRRR